MFLFFNEGEDRTVRYIAAVILKNIIKTQYAMIIDTKFDEELKEIEFICFIMLAQEALGHKELDLKLWTELKFILS